MPRSANANWIPILDFLRVLLRTLWIPSFRLVPPEGGISDKQPFRTWTDNFSVSLIALWGITFVPSYSTDFYCIRKLSMFFSIILTDGVDFDLFIPWSVGSLRINLKSCSICVHSFWSGPLPPFFGIFVTTLCIAWKGSSFIDTSSKTEFSLCLHWQQLSI